MTVPLMVAVTALGGKRRSAPVQQAANMRMPNARRMTENFMFKRVAVVPSCPFLQYSSIDRFLRNSGLTPAPTACDMQVPKCENSMFVLWIKIIET